MISNEGQTKVLCKANSKVIFGNMITIKIDTGKMGFAIFEASNNEVIVVRILIVSLLV
jgi:hypothetical protein